MPKKEPHSRMKILMLEKVPHGLMNSRSFILFMIYWEVRLKPPNIALSLVLHWLPGTGRDRLVFVLWACSCSARRWLDLPIGPGFVVIHRPTQMPRVRAPHYITLQAIGRFRPPPPPPKSNSQLKLKHFYYWPPSSQHVGFHLCKRSDFVEFAITHIRVFCFSTLW